MKKLLVSCGLAAVAFSLSACATITRGSSQKYNIDTTPTQADVKLSTGHACVSPCKLKLKRKKGFTVTASKDGYEPATAVVESRVRGGGIAGGAGNIVAGGLIGIAVDASSGAMNDLTPNPLHLTLKPVAAPVAAVEPAPVEIAAVPAAESDPLETGPAVEADPAVDAAAPTASEEAAAPAPGGE